MPILPINLTFTGKAVSGWTVDPRTKNRVPTYTLVTLGCYVKPMSNRVFLTNLIQPGLNQDEVTVEGYLMEPSEYPPGIGHGSIGKATYNIGGKSVTTEARIDLKPDGAFDPLISEVLGQRCRFTLKLPQGGTP